MTSPFHPDLRRAALLIPRVSFGPMLLGLMRRLQRRHRPPPVVAGLAIDDVIVPHAGHPDGVRLRVYRPIAATGPLRALLWIHGGGYIIGAPEQDEQNSIDLALGHGMVVAAVAYRHAPDHPYPAAIEDCYAALRWLDTAADGLGIDRGRIAIGGASAGGGLAAGLALLARDRGGPAIAFQLLVYPMIDDRTDATAVPDPRRLRLWTAASNRFAWSAYLRGTDRGAVPAYAAPARAADLTGLPPAWIGVGTLDLFRRECGAYAERLREAGVACTLVEVDGAFHGFDAVASGTGVARAFRAGYADALAAALG